MDGKALGRILRKMEKNKEGGQEKEEDWEEKEKTEMKRNEKKRRIGGGV